MGIYNLLVDVPLTCPRCKREAVVEVDFRIGNLDLVRYRIGDKLHWRPDSLPPQGIGPEDGPLYRPPEGSCRGTGYVVCPLCQRDFWVAVHVDHDRLAIVSVDHARKGYTPD